MFFLFYTGEEAPRYGDELARARAVFDAARQVAPDISVATFASFLHVCERNAELADRTLSLTDLADEMGVPYPRLMRHLDVLSDGTPSQPGHNLLDKIVDPAARRNRKFRPSTKGDALARAVAQAAVETTSQD